MVRSRYVMVISVSFESLSGVFIIFLRGFKAHAGRLFPPTFHNSLTVSNLSRVMLGPLP